MQRSDARHPKERLPKRWGQARPCQVMGIQFSHIRGDSPSTCWQCEGLFRSNNSQQTRVGLLLGPDQRVPGRGVPLAQGSEQGPRAVFRSGLMRSEAEEICSNPCAVVASSWAVMNQEIQKRPCLSRRWWSVI